MKFIEFLTEKTESPYKTKQLSDEEILEVFKKNCSNMKFDRPLWRGMRGDSDGYILQGEKGERKSINTSNHYTVAIDHFIKEYGKPDWPLRSKSVICASYKNQDHAQSFGNDLYAIFPFDDVNCGVTPEDDIWAVKFRYSERYSMTTLNDDYREHGIKSDSYPELVKGLNNFLKDESNSKEKLYSFFKEHEDKLEDFLKEIYFDNIGFEYMNSLGLNKLSDKREVWLSGQCLAVKYKTWLKLLNSV